MLDCGEPDGPACPRGPAGGKPPGPICPAIIIARGLLPPENKLESKFIGFIAFTASFAIGLFELPKGKFAGLEEEFGTLGTAGAEGPEDCGGLEGGAEELAGLEFRFGFDAWAG